MLKQKKRTPSLNLTANQSTEPNQSLAETKSKIFIPWNFTFVQTLWIDTKYAQNKKPILVWREEIGTNLRFRGRELIRKGHGCYQSNKCRAQSETRGFLFPFSIHCKKWAAFHFFSLLLISSTTTTTTTTKFGLIGFHLGLQANKKN